MSSNADRFNGSIDEKNGPLLDSFETAGIQIDFEVRSGTEYWAVQPRAKYAIAAPNSLPNPEMLAHELLHIMVGTFGFLSTQVIVSVFTNRNCRFSTSELPNWQNSLAHCKMFRHFIGMGYNASKFIANDESSFHLKQLVPLLGEVEDQIEAAKKDSKELSAQILEDFLSVLIAVKSYEIQYAGLNQKPIDPSFYYTKLRACNSDLFDTINEEFNAWVSDQDNYSNVDFYNRINQALERLGYPIVGKY